MSARLAGRQKIRWENYIQKELKIMEINKQCIQDWVVWKEVGEKAKTFVVVVAAATDEEAEDIRVLLFESSFVFCVVNV